MNKRKRQPLGYIELETGVKEIMHLNDFFLSYLFHLKENWEVLRSIHNILVSACKELHQEKATDLQPITNTIEVESQYEYILDKVRNKRQDAMISEHDSNLTFIEFQNRAYSSPAIDIRGVEYLALGIGRTRSEQLANQVWILAEHHQGLLGDSSFEMYALASKLTGRAYPNKSNIFYISLEKLCELDNQVGELSRLLMGINPEPTDSVVREIAESFNRTFKIVQEDKEARYKMSSYDFIKDEGKFEERISIAMELLSLGLPLEQIVTATKLSFEKISELVQSKS